jgi:RimJ/RimL family protein N-acetyltransferase
MDDASLDLELGPRLHWTPVERPGRVALRGRFVSLEPFESRHVEPLFQAAEGDGADPVMWRYLNNGPFGDIAPFRTWVEANMASEDPLYYAVVPEGGKASGQTTFMRMDPVNGVIEIGHIWFGGSIQRSPATTEAIYLMAVHAFDTLGYRRLEWKCHARNQRSRRAAERFGFTYEGTFRNHVITRDRNRDTAWYSIIAEEWPTIRSAFEAWLSPDNFDADGAQVRSLTEIRNSL